MTSLKAIGLCYFQGDIREWAPEPGTDVVVSHAVLQTGTNPVLGWVRGTALRPVLAVLPDAEGAEFERDYADMLAAAYPPEPDGGTLCAFRRLFAVGAKRAPGNSPAA